MYSCLSQAAVTLSKCKSVKCRCVKCGAVRKCQASCTSVLTKEQLPDFLVYLQHPRKVYLWITVSEADPLEQICVKVHFVVWGADCASTPSRALLSLIFISPINPNIPFIQTITSYPFAATYLLKAVLWELRTFSLKADVEPECWPNHKVKTIERAIFNLSLLCLEWKCTDCRRER